MTRIALLTRPLPVQDGVVEVLARGGMHSMHLPTLQVVPYNDIVFEPQLSTDITTYSGVVFVSQHAVLFAAERLVALQLKLAPSTWLACVGGASGQAIAQSWPHASLIMPSSIDEQDSEGLWQALRKQALVIPKHKILVVRAQTGRDTLLNRLKTAGVLVNVWTCYQRNVIEWSIAQQVQVLQALANNGLVLSITSTEGLHSLMKQIKSWPANLLQQPVVTIHPAIANAVQQYGFTQIKCVAPQHMAEAILAQR